MSDPKHARHAAPSNNAEVTNSDETVRMPVATPQTKAAGTQTAAVVIPKKKKKSKAKKIVAAVVIVLVVLIGAGCAYGAWYMNSISNNVALDDDTKQALDSVLVPATQTDINSSNQAAEPPFYVLVMGSDNWESYGERSDAMILVRVDPTKHQITMVSIPRDTPYELDGRTVKINQAFAEYGAAGAVQAAEELTGVQISHYVEIQFAGLADYVDSIGGITVDVPYTFDYQVYTKDYDMVHIDAGVQTLDGTEAVALARNRTSYDHDQDAVRQSNIRALAMSLMNSVIKAPVSEIPGLVQSLSSCVSTDIDINTLIGWAAGFAQAGDTKMYTCTGPYKGDIDESTGLWLCYPDPQSWTTLMASVDAGENPGTTANQINGK